MDWGATGTCIGCWFTGKLPRMLASGGGVGGLQQWRRSRGDAKRLALGLQAADENDVCAAVSCECLHAPLRLRQGLLPSAGRGVCASTADTLSLSSMTEGIRARGSCRTCKLPQVDTT
jgi:hypothetical protein